MSFVFTLALLMGLLVVLPILAHLLRRGRADTTPFAPIQLIPPLEHVAKHRSQLQNRLLLVVRSLVILSLALLGATPLIRCDRTLLSRTNGASVAAVIVLDDSGSMRSRLGTGGTRFARAKRGALELIDQAREGDSIGLVLAGKPARVLLLPTTSPRLLRAQLELAKETDRPTDLVSAVALAEAALARQPHVDKQVIVLSDGAGATPSSSPHLLAPLPELTSPISDCGVISAIRNRGHVTVDVACSDAHPRVERRVQVVRATPSNTLVREKTIALHPGHDSVSFDDIGTQEELSVRLLGPDDNPHDDTTPVVDGGRGPCIATYTDPITGRSKTGGAPILEQALRSLDDNVEIRSLATVPEDSHELVGVDLLILDAPPLLSAEARSAIVAFTERGGTAVAFFGPTANQAQLGSLLLPFIERRATWEDTAPSGLDPSSLSSLGVASTSFDALAAKGRLLFDESHDAKVMIKGRWSDQRPFWIERPLGRGLLFALGLPASQDESDLALQTGFLALLAEILQRSESLGTARTTTVGKPWRFPARTRLEFEGPSGPLYAERTEESERMEQVIVPIEKGVYRITQDGQRERRVSLFPAEEVTESPRPWPVAAMHKPDRTTGRLDLSRSIAMGLIPLLALELMLGSSFARGFLQNFGGWFTRWVAKRRVKSGGPVRR